jgi:hypothetical protein
MAVLSNTNAKSEKPKLKKAISLWAILQWLWRYGGSGIGSDHR